MDEDATYICDACGEEIVIPIDLSAGTHQEYVEDCPVCCRPNVVHLDIEESGEVRSWAEPRIAVDESQWNWPTPLNWIVNLKGTKMEIPGLSGLSPKKHVDSFVERVLGQLAGIVFFIAVIWGVFLTDYIPFIEWHRWLALRPRQLIGLHGILTMPFVHGGIAHILSNTIPLIITLLTLATMRPKTWPWVVGTLIVVSGAMTWLLGENTLIVGASGLVLALVTFLVAPGGFLLAWWGFHRLRGESKPYPLKILPIPLVVSAVVGFFCLDNLFFNLVPVFAPMGWSQRLMASSLVWCDRRTDRRFPVRTERADGFVARRSEYRTRGSGRKPEQSLQVINRLGLGRTHEVTH